jgi:CheY-like chemotaxis protein
VGYVKRILIADDSAVMRKTLRRMFEGAGWIICAEATDGQDAITKAVEATPDVVVLDFSMPAMNGLTAGRILKKLVPRIPLILFTSFARVLDSMDIQLSGFSALIDKNDAGRLIRTAESLLHATV